VASPRKVPSFFLFGEPPRVVEGKFLHLENLDDRTRSNDWNIRAHTHADLNHIFYITAGGGFLSADGRHFAFAAPCFLMIPARVVHGLIYAQETTGAVLTLADSYLRVLVQREPEFAFLFRAPRALALDNPSAVERAFEGLSRELVWTAPGHAAAVEAHLLGLLVEALRADTDDKAARSSPGGPAELVARFRETVEGHYRERLSLQDYAARLGVPAARLRAACVEVTAAPPMRLVNERLMLEAKRALLYSNMTIAEAAYHLGLDDPAYFSRLFAKSTGLSPRAYRRQAAL